MIRVHIDNWVKLSFRREPSMTWRQGIMGALRREGTEAAVTLAEDDRLKVRGGLSYALSALIPRDCADAVGIVATEAGKVTSADRAQTDPPDYDYLNLPGEDD